MNATHTAWLRRLSDYHSGGISDAERDAVERHLSGCSECQEALVMYRRFYTLAHSPLRLGPAHYALQQGGDSSRSGATSVTSPTPQSTWPPAATPPRSPHPRRRMLSGIAAVLAAVLVVAGFLFALNTRGPEPPSAAATRARIATATAAARATAAEGTPAATTTGAVQPTTFVCANPAGSSLVYAYRNESGAIFTVTGCSAPKLVYAGQGMASPVAWSPANRYLAIDVQPDIGNGFVLDTIVLVDTHAGTSVRTHYSISYGPDVAAGQTYHTFLGWLDDSTFVGAVVPVVAGRSGPATGPVSIVRVDVASQRETTIATVTWFADAKVRAGKYLFYGGYQSASEGQGYVHRLDLTSGQDTKLVPLGFAGQAGCQGSPLCNWTAPWDVTADGGAVIVHNPGPTKPWTDTSMPPDSPLYQTNLSGASPVQPIVSKLATSLTTPVYSPDGQYVATGGASYDPSNPYSHMQAGLTRLGGTTTLVDGGLISWRADSHAIVLMYTNGPLLYDLTTGATTLLQYGTSNYLWGN